MSRKQTLFMETTFIEPSRSAAEVSAELIKAGATQIATDYKNGEVSGLRWTMTVSGNTVLFQIPARVDELYRYICKRDNKQPYKASDPNRGAINYPDVMTKAKRVAWRQLLRWVQAQMAMIETGMVRAEEVFLPYLFNPVKEQTLFEQFQGSGFKMIEGPKQ